MPVAFGIVSGPAQPYIGQVSTTNGWAVVIVINKCMESESVQVTQNRKHETEDCNGQPTSEVFHKHVLIPSSDLEDLGLTGFNKR